MAEAEKWNPIESLGATGATVAHNVERLRREQRLAFTELSERLAAIGRVIPTLGLRKIESGGRRVDVDDLVAIAVALGVSPATLLMPGRNDDGVEVQSGDLVAIAGWQKPITAEVVWEWLKAAEPLMHGTMASFVQQSWPVWERERFDTDLIAIQRRNREELYRSVPDQGATNGDD